MRVLNGTRFVIDLDNTICETNETIYHLSRPKKDIIKIINKLYDEGNYILIFTARGYVLKKDFRELTELQLKTWGVKYDELKFGKPNADYYIDDKNLSIKDFIERFK